MSQENRTGIFVHGVIDDAGLSAAERSVLMHVARRGACHAKLDTMKRICRVDRVVLQRCLCNLIDRRIIRKRREIGYRTPVYEVNPLSAWVSVISPLSESLTVGKPASNQSENRLPSTSH